MIDFASTTYLPDVKSTSKSYFATMFTKSLTSLIELSNRLNFILKEYGNLEDCESASYGGDCIPLSRAGKDMYWRIVRINGDGTVRMIYDGTSIQINGIDSIDRLMTASSYNNMYYDNSFVGYMNGTTDGTTFPNGTTVSKTYDEAHANITDSTIKTYLEDTWYAENVNDTSYEQYIVDAIYCNDRSLDTSNSSYTGIGKTVTHYASYQRVSESPYVPKLICERQEDRFTYNASVGTVSGNDKLEAPVGLITADELRMAGIGSGSNNYLNNGSSYGYWTMSPVGYTRGNANVLFEEGGRIVYYEDSSLNGLSIGEGVRAILTLSTTAITSGSGTRTNPFVVG